MALRGREPVLGAALMYWRMYRMSFRRRSGTEVKTPRAMTSRSHGDTIYVTGLRRSNPTRERSASVQSNARQSSCWNS